MIIKNIFSLVVVLIPAILTAGNKELTLVDIWGSSKLRGKSERSIQWMNDGRSYSYAEIDTATKMKTLYRANAESQKKNAVVSELELKKESGDSSFSFTSYQWSPDERQILFVSAPPEKQYLSRLTPAGNLFLYDCSGKKISRITNAAVPQYNQKFSPDGKSIGFVRENNIYVYEIASGKEMQITFDGNANVINGKFDWVYEEEFGIADGWQWSPDGLWIAFWQLDQTRVPEYMISEWDSTHPEPIIMKYPKPGDRNAVARIGVYNVNGRTVSWLDTGSDSDAYIPRMLWTREKNVLSVQRLNRAQNTLELLSFDVSTGASKVILTERSDTWVDVHDDLRFLKNGNFTWSSERDGYNHVYLYSRTGERISQVTTGQWDVSSFYGIDEQKGIVYYSSSEVSPVERHLYSVSIDGNKKRLLSPGPGTHSASFSPSFEFFVDHCSSTSQPSQARMMKNDGMVLDTLESNEIGALQDYSFPPVSISTFTTSDGMPLYCSMMKPLNFDSTRKYPVLVFTYGGPGSQVVENSWGGSNYLWHAYLAQKGYIIFMVDNRGTGARGAAFKKIIYRNLGKWEVNDQIEGAKYLGSLPFVDKERIGIWGWSYGGYLASHTILIGAEYFKTAIAVAPVIHWKFYDTIYAERFMGTPGNNPEGYRESAPMNHAAKLKGKFLLIHGMSDDNVHFQNSVNMVSALQKGNKQFQTMFYPGKNHGISGGKTRLHLYTLMTNFILANL